jgi:hypothetical protein
LHDVLTLVIHLRAHADAACAMQHQGLGARGGLQKETLLQLKASGDTWREHGMAHAPHLLAADGSVAVPRTWGTKLRDEAGAAGTHPAA